VERLFSYGTLRQAEVQLSLFGREVATVDDALPGFRLEMVKITDADVIAKSGSDVHPILRRGAAQDAVRGAFLELSEAELACADAYEVDDYERVPVELASGLNAWVYVAADDA
jgi:gamma-glutamylcyclotransferase (GGCT)/AIG2-like uncharacterized protein YtfP